MSDPARLTAVEAARALASGELTSQALVSSCLQRIRNRDADVAAWAHIDAEKALAAARASDARRASRRTLGALDGIPVGVKDIIDTADYPTEYGSAVFAGRQPEADASVANQLKAQGAVLLGKTVTTELAFFGPGKTKNPFNPRRTPGGSSSGSAAAVADFQVPLALGTQTAGSIMRPASYCGAVGFKPTFGYVSRTGVLAQSAPLDTIGGLARSVPDVALLIDAINAVDAADHDMTPGKKASLAAALDIPLERPPRLAFVKTSAWPLADRAAQNAIQKFVGSFGARAEIAETSLPGDFDEAFRLQQTVQFADIAKNYGPIADVNADRVSAKLKEIIAIGRKFSAADYASARAEKEPLYEQLRPILVNYDAILTLAAPGAALDGLAATGTPVFNAVWTYLGMPVISLPLLEADGLPLGAQLIAARDNDAGLLRAADWFMRNTTLN